MVEHIGSPKLQDTTITTGQQSRRSSIHPTTQGTVALGRCIDHIKPLCWNTVRFGSFAFSRSVKKTELPSKTPSRRSAFLEVLARRDQQVPSSRCLLFEFYCVFQVEEMLRGSRGESATCFKHVIDKFDDPR